ncbi:MAG TPA: hypothetical protein VNL95_00450 [Dehalococcoidia bacterium]|nr:hypothetical protein [Dehalococcoidia bacterium]
MDSDSRIEALEEELRLLKAEVKSVLLDIREVVLSRTNPLQFDLPQPSEEALAPPDGYQAPALGEAPQAEEEAPSLPAQEEEAPRLEPEPQSAAARDHGATGTPPPEEPAPRWQPPLVGGDFVAWLASSLRELGPQRLGHLLAMYRLVRPLPANMNLALGHLQELLASSDDPEPYWLKALVELDNLAR